MKKIHSLSELEQLKTLTESMQCIEEAPAGPVAYEDMVGDAGYIAFESEKHFNIVVQAMDAVGEGSAYPGGAKSTFKQELDVEIEQVVPKKVILKIKEALHAGSTSKIKRALNLINKYYFGEFE